MEFLIELLLDLIIEGSIEISSNKKVSKFIRYPLIVLIILFFTLFILGLMLLGIIILKENIYFGILLLIIVLILLISGINKLKNIFLEKRK